MRQACACLQGRHNFAAFEGAPRGAEDKRKRVSRPDAVCTLHSVALTEVVEVPTGASGWQKTTGTTMTTTYELEVTGDRFLYKMVRFVVGAVVAVGKGKMTVADLERLLETGVRRENEIPCAPAYGLVLHQVDYDPAIEIDWQQATS